MNKINGILVKLKKKLTVNQLETPTHLWTIKMFLSCIQTFPNALVCYTLACDFCMH